jgi:SAM-dependent methyltransferase
MPAFNYALIADVYDRYVTVDFDIPFYLEESRRTEGRVLELMCGTGRISLPLLRAGVSLTCVDSSPEMLFHLHQKLAQSGLSADVVEQDVTKLALLRPYTLAFIPFNSFSEIKEKADQLSTLGSIRRCLTDEGRLIVTLHNPSVRLKKVDAHSHHAGRFSLDEGGNTIALETREEYHPETELVTGQQAFEAFNKEGKSLWKRVVDISFRLIWPREFQSLLSEAGFAVECVFGDYDRSSFAETISPFMIWCLRK